jgi:biotin transport system substrate-specific component
METVKLIQNNKVVKKAIIVFFGTVLLTISAKVKIPFYPVPMTMQTFVVIFLGMCLGYKLGLATVSLYLIEGIVGIPVFSNSPEKGVGMIYFTGPTMGYLLGFIIAVYAAGKFNFNKNYVSNFIKIFFAVLPIYVLGLIWLGILIGWDKPIFDLGAKPFLLAELFKIFLLVIISTKVDFFKKFI